MGTGSLTTAIDAPSRDRDVGASVACADVWSGWEALETRKMIAQSVSSAVAMRAVALQQLDRISLANHATLHHRRVERHRAVQLTADTA